MKYFVLAFLIMCGPALAHDWYPSECCSQQDCFEIQESALTYTDKGIRLPSGETLLHGDERIRMTPLPQTGFHWCVHDEAFENMSETICLFLPNQGV